ncbi:MAG: hypothetical protein COZ33_05830 [Nitrospirae bacterium CG_4_10_14_3_um_filter_70_108]|nr:MAG: hypothetical protein COZ33_05830 [Nitrospirae bacterium CG_4_10_14_3_um_filter_70_108]
MAVDPRPERPTQAGLALVDLPPEGESSFDVARASQVSKAAVSSAMSVGLSMVEPGIPSWLRSQGMGSMRSSHTLLTTWLRLPGLRKAVFPPAHAAPPHKMRRAVSDAASALTKIDCLPYTMRTRSSF